MIMACKDGNVNHPKDTWTNTSFMTCRGVICKNMIPMALMLAVNVRHDM